MQNISVDYRNVLDFVKEDEIFSLYGKLEQFKKQLLQKTGRGNDFLGWVKLPNEITLELIDDINNTANQFKKNLEVVVVVGIGGSYLGARAIIEALSSSFSHLDKQKGDPLIIYAGHNISEDYLSELQCFLSNKEFGIVVISKSGTTTEPAIAFRILKGLLEEKMGKKNISDRVIAITDKDKGALKQLAAKEGYKTYIIPDDVGGRYSVLTPVGLLPIAIAGFDIKKIIEGSKDMAKICEEKKEGENPALKYASVRNILYSSGKTTEILANYHPKLVFISEWWKQLYGESEGKEGKGIFPASVTFSTDLHSMGQYIQEGKRNLFETVLTIDTSNTTLLIPEDSVDLDKLNYLAGRNIDDVNKKAELGTMLAHVDGGVPNIKIHLPLLNEYYLGQLIYFFEFACGISGYFLDINPFDQPGVEEYKRNMFALLGKPGFEEDTENILKRIQ